MSQPWRFIVFVCLLLWMIHLAYSLFRHYSWYIYIYRLWHSPLHHCFSEIVGRTRLVYFSLRDYHRFSSSSTTTSSSIILLIITIIIVVDIVHKHSIYSRACVDFVFVCKKNFDRVVFVFLRLWLLSLSLFGTILREEKDKQTKNKRLLSVLFVSYCIIFFYLFIENNKKKPNTHTNHVDYSISI